MTLLVAFCTCYVFALDLADVLLMSAPAPVAYDVGVHLIVRIPRRPCLLRSLLLLTEHLTCCVHSRFPLIDLVLNFLHGSCLELYQFLLERIVRAGS